MDQSRKCADRRRKIQSTRPFHSAEKDQTGDMDGCAPHLGKDCVQSEGRNVFTPRPCHMDDLLFSEFGSMFLTLKTYTKKRNKKSWFSVHGYK